MDRQNSSASDLTRAQRRAILHVRSLGSRMRDKARHDAEHILMRAGMSVAVLDALLASIHSHGPVTLNFHPDRIASTGVTVVEGLLRTGIYQSQFATGVSNGSRTAYSGGERDEWERVLFGGAYHAGSGSPPEERPKYGGLNLMSHADGASPRFGSCYFELRPHVLTRSTFTFGDSHTQPEAVGTIDAFDAVLGELLASVESTRFALGVQDVDVPALVRRLLSLGDAKYTALRSAVGRSLDHYIEAQVHGEISLRRDVEALVADPSYQDTATGRRMAALAQEHGFALAWHSGFRLAAAAVPEDFRGPAIPPFARRVARFAGEPGILDAATLGRAAASLHDHPESWRDLGTPDETFQYLKQLWHVLVHLGQ